MASDNNCNVFSRRGFLTWTGGTIAYLADGERSLYSAAIPETRADSQPVKIPDWVYGVTRMAFLTPGEVEKAAKAGAQVVHTNLIWPYFPLRRQGGGLTEKEAQQLHKLVDDCHRHQLKLVLGLPPFPPVKLVQKHPQWRVHPADSDAALNVAANEQDLGTRLCCNFGPWGDYLIDVCAELVSDYRVDGFSFDGNYHPPICYCPACKSAYRNERKRPLPGKASLDDIDYRTYLVWRGEKLEDHYRRMQQRIKQANPNAVLMSWTVNAGRYGHFLHSPRAMPTRLNQLFDLPMQEWWLDETNQGGSLAPAFGAAYLRATTGGRPCASEPYLMSRGNPYGTDSFPAHERLTRCLLAVANGNILAESLGWPGHDVAADFQEVARRAPFLTRAETLPWAALLVSEQTRQFYAYRDIAERFLPHVFGAFRAATEEHVPLTLLNDWDVRPDRLARYAVVILPNTAALSTAQVDALRRYVQDGGGLVATGETSLCDELGRPRGDFALADLFGVSYQGRPQAPLNRPAFDQNYAIALDEAYWKQRVGVCTLSWTNHALVRDARLRELVPRQSVVFRGPLVRISEPKDATEVAVRMRSRGKDGPAEAAVVLHHYGAGKVAYFAPAVDAALWSYAYPYQRRLFVRAIEWAARAPSPITVKAPLCVQATYFTQSSGDGGRILVHLFNGVNTTANHGFPAMDVPLREEVIPIHGIEVAFHKDAPKRYRCEPGNRPLQVRLKGKTTIIQAPPLDIHALIVGEYA